MTDERHPIGEYLDANRDALASMYLYEHPEQDGPITMEQMESWIAELLDDGFREHYKRIEIMAHRIEESREYLDKVGDSQ